MEAEEVDFVADRLRGLADGWGGLSNGLRRKCCLGLYSGSIQWYGISEDGDVDVDVDVPKAVASLPSLYFISISTSSCVGSCVDEVLKRDGHAVLNADLICQDRRWARMGDKSDMALLNVDEAVARSGASSSSESRDFSHADLHLFLMAPNTFTSRG